MGVRIGKRDFPNKEACTRFSAKQKHIFTKGYQIKSTKTQHENMWLHIICV